MTMPATAAARLLGRPRHRLRADVRHLRQRFSAAGLEGYR
jgi:hypothetical protein